MNAKSNDSPDEAQWDFIIRPKTGWFDLNLRALWHYRDLILLFVRRDLVVVYKQTILGPLWYFIQPLLSTLTMTVIFGQIAQIPTDGVPPFLFYLGGTTAWAHFSSCLIGTSNIFGGNAGIFGKVYFPRLTVPISMIISGSVKFLIHFGIFLACYVYFSLNGANLKINGIIILLPLLFIHMATLGLAVGVIISSLITKYRDLAVVVNFAVQLWMYSSPVIYPVSQVPEKYRELYMLNPMASILEWFKYAFFGVGTIKADQLILSWLITIGLLFIGLLLFNKAEKTFMDTV